MKKTSFLYGSFLVASVNLLVGLLSFSYDVLLSKLLGAESIGMFKMANSVLLLLLMLTTAGLPTALARLTAQYHAQGKPDIAAAALKTSLCAALLASFLLGGLLLLAAPYISLSIFDNRLLAHCLYASVPALVLISATSILRGYYYGLKKITTASSSEIIEHGARFILILGFLTLTSPVSPLYGALVAVWGISIGEVFDLLWLLAMRKNSITGFSGFIGAKPRLLPALLGIAAPLTLSGLSSTLLQAANAVLLPQRLLAAGLTHAEALAAFGRVMGMVMPLLFLPFTVTSALVVNIIPSLSAEVSRKDAFRASAIMQQSVKMTLLVSLPLTLILFLQADALAVLLYSDPHVGQLLRAMSGATLLLSLQHTFSGILNALGRQVQATLHRLLSTAVQLVLMYFLAATPRCGIYGYVLSFFVYLLLLCVLDFNSIGKAVGFRPSYSGWFLKPLAASAYMAAALFLTRKWLYSMDIRGSWNTAGSLCTSLLLYVFFLFINHIIPPDFLPRPHNTSK